MKPMPPDGFYPFRWKTRRDEHDPTMRLHICPNCSAWFHYDNHHTYLSGEQPRKENPFDYSEQWRIHECNWCKARVWSSGHYSIHGKRSYYEPRPVEIARNPLRHERFPKAELPIEPYGLVFPHTVKPELIHSRVFVDYPDSGFPSPDVLDDRVKIRQIIDGVKRETEWELPELLNSMWINYWTASIVTVPLICYDRFGYPTVHEERELGWNILSLGHWHQGEVLDQLLLPAGCAARRNTVRVVEVRSETSEIFDNVSSRVRLASTDSPSMKRLAGTYRAVAR